MRFPRPVTFNRTKIALQGHSTPYCSFCQSNISHRKGGEAPICLFGLPGVPRRIRPCGGSRHHFFWSSLALCLSGPCRLCLLTPLATLSMLGSLYATTVPAPVAAASLQIEAAIHRWRDTQWQLLRLTRALLTLKTGNKK